MQIFAWSDLHLEIKTNFELVKQFCKLHPKRRAYPESAIKCNSSVDDTPNRVWLCSHTALGHSYALAGEDSRHADCLPEHTGKQAETATDPTPPNEDFSQDVLILAGDVHYDLNGLKESLQLFSSVFGHVAFVPGNHELWVTQKDRQSGIEDSVQKLDSILLLCDSLGVHTRPFAPCKGVQVVPLLSWYDEFDPQFCSVAASSPHRTYPPPRTGQPSSEFSVHGVLNQFSNSGLYNRKALMSLSENWMDYCACKWPYPLCNNDPRADGDHGIQQSCYAQYETGTTSAGESMFHRLEKSRRDNYQVGTSPSPIHKAYSGWKTALGFREAGGTLLESRCYEWSINKAELPRDFQAKCSSRLTRDSWGMPLSLAEFFALENERRNCFGKTASKESTNVLMSRENGMDLQASSSISEHYQSGKKSPDDMLSGQLSQMPLGEYFASYQEDKHGRAPIRSEKNPLVITFSHFLPRAELARIYPLTPSALAYVMGSNRIDNQLRQAGSSLHVFGHSHINADIQIEGVRYVQNSLGRTSEQKWFPERRKPKVIFEVET